MLEFIMPGINGEALVSFCCLVARSLLVGDVAPPHGDKMSGCGGCHTQVGVK